MVERFGYAFAAIFVVEDNRLKLGAQRGYAVDMSEFDPRTGVVGRAARSASVSSRAGRPRRPRLRPGDRRVVSEIAAPMVLDGVLLGVLNIESTARAPGPHRP